MTYRLTVVLTGIICCIACTTFFSGCSDSVDKVKVTGISAQARVVIDATLCTGCAPRYCYESCPQHAIDELEMTPGIQYVYVIDPQKCINCGICMRKCPQNAIIWKR
jgi:NAD-dependent dihydropyrimidine dehydrogenase PreA subunit